MKTSPEDLVDKFVEEKHNERATGCATCKLKNAESINRACVAFQKLREDGTTTQTWNGLFKHVIVPNFNYPMGVQSLRRHIKGCLGHE